MSLELLLHLEKVLFLPIICGMIISFIYFLFCVTFVRQTLKIWHQYLLFILLFVSAFSWRMFFILASSRYSLIFIFISVFIILSLFFTIKNSTNSLIPLKTLNFILVTLFFITVFFCIGKTVVHDSKLQAIEFIIKTARQHTELEKNISIIDYNNTYTSRFAYYLNNEISIDPIRGSSGLNAGNNLFHSIMTEDSVFFLISLKRLEEGLAFLDTFKIISYDEIPISEIAAKELKVKMFKITKNTNQLKLHSQSHLFSDNATKMRQKGFEIFVARGVDWMKDAYLQSPFWWYSWPDTFSPKACETFKSSLDISTGTLLWGLPDGRGRLVSDELIPLEQNRLYGLVEFTPMFNSGYVEVIGILFDEDKKFIKTQSLAFQSISSLNRQRIYATVYRQNYPQASFIRFGVHLSYSSVQLHYFNFYN